MIFLLIASEAITSDRTLVGQQRVATDWANPKTGVTAFRYGIVHVEI